MIAAGHDVPTTDRQDPLVTNEYDVIVGAPGGACCRDPRGPARRPWPS
jgi:hypothetical protein